jgi:hypothetical protein
LVNLPFFKPQKESLLVYINTFWENPAFYQHYDIGRHPAKQAENEGQNVAE